MKKRHIIKISLLNLFFLSSVVFPQDNHINNIKNYMAGKNQTYPIHIDTSLRNSFYRDWSLNNKDGFYLQIDEPLNDFDFRLSIEQKNKLERFFAIFISESEYIVKLVEMSEIKKFSINNIIIEHYDWRDEDYIVLSIMFYNDHKLYETWQYDEKNKIWLMYNMAYYSFSNDTIEFQGWGVITKLFGKNYKFIAYNKYFIRRLKDGKNDERILKKWWCTPVLRITYAI